MPVTQKFIANKVGVSQKTISLFFKGSANGLSEETRVKIKKVADEYNYIPNFAARAIKTKCLKKIAMLLVGHTVQGYTGNSRLLSYVSASADELAKHGYSLVIEKCYVDINKQVFTRKPEFFKSISVDGIIGVAGTVVQPFIDNEIAKLDLPIVWLNRKNVPENVPALTIDEYTSAKQLAEYIVSKGHKKVIWYGPDYKQSWKQHYSARDRFQGINDVCSKAGVEVVRILGDTGMKLVQISRNEILPLENVDCIIAYNHDYFNAAFYSYVQEKPEIVNNVEFVKFSSPWEESHHIENLYTNLRIPENEISINGTKYLLSVLNDKEDKSLLKPVSGELIRK